MTNEKVKETTALTQEQSAQQRSKGEERIVTKYEYAWRYLFIIAATLGAALATKIYEFQTSPVLELVPKGRLRDFWVSVVVALVVAVIRILITRAYKQKVFLMLSPKKIRSPEDGQRRADQICKWIFDLIYYIGSTLGAYLVLREQRFLPPYLGGPSDGSCSNIFASYPNVPEIPYIVIFYQIQAGNHLFTFVNHVFFKNHEPKFFEYVLHHGLALFLIVYSYLLNFLPVGAIVLMLHDPCDVMLILYRGYADLKNKKIVISMIFGFVAYFVFIALRIFIQPICVLKTIFFFYLEDRSLELASIVNFPILFQLSMLFILSIMQYYWLAYMTKGAINLFIKGKEKDGYDN